MSNRTNKVNPKIQNVDTPMSTKCTFSIFSICIVGEKVGVGVGKGVVGTGLGIEDG